MNPSNVLNIELGFKKREAQARAAQLSTDKRNKTICAMRLLRSGHGLCKAILQSGIGWIKGAEAICSFVDWDKFADYERRNISMGPWEGCAA